MSQVKQVKFEQRKKIEESTLNKNFKVSRAPFGLNVWQIRQARALHILYWTRLIYRPKHSESLYNTKNITPYIKKWWKELEMMEIITSVVSYTANMHIIFGVL